jgi:hypothetical protein
MASISIIGMPGWSKLSIQPSGAFGPSPSLGVGLRAPFFFGRGITGITDHTRQDAWIAPFGLCSVIHDAPVHPRFLVRPQLLTRVSLLPMGRSISLNHGVGHSQLLPDRATALQHRR